MKTQIQNINAKVRNQMQSALKSQNAYDLYDALADNGLETQEVRDNGMDVDWLIKHISGFLSA